MRWTVTGARRPEARADGGRAGRPPARRRRGVALAVLWLSCLAGAPVAAAGLVVTLDAGAGPDEVVFRLANDGEGTLFVLTAGTPLAAVPATDAFSLERPTKDWPARERARYVGRVAKRVPPSPEDFVALLPGASRTAVVTLGADHEVPSRGDYRVAWHGTILVRGTASVARPVRLAARGPSVRLEPGSSVRARPAAFERCDADHRAALDEATPAAERLVADALAALDARPDGALAVAPRYTRWFGPWAAVRERRVRTVYAALLDMLSGSTLTYDCSCTDEDLYAFVYPSRTGDVFLCPAFFRAELLGTDSRAGTLVHELTHFPTVAGTDDHVYGHEAAAALAARDPGLAVANADNYEYFAENTPALPMEGGPAVAPEGAPVDDAPVAVPADDAPPEAGPAFTALPLDAVVTGALEGGRLERFTASGADAVVVDSIAGDADLYVFDDPALDALVCASTSLERSGAPESCRIDAGRTAYVVVHAYTDTRYAIRATSVARPLPAPVPTALPASEPVPAIGPPPDARPDDGEEPPADAAPDASTAPAPPAGPVPSAASTGSDGGLGAVGRSGALGILAVALAWRRATARARRRRYRVAGGSSGMSS